MLFGDLNRRRIKSDNQQDDANFNNVRIPAFGKKKIAAIPTAAAKHVVEKLLRASTNTILEEKGQDEQDMSIKKIQIQTKIN